MLATVKERQILLELINFLLPWGFLVKFVHAFAHLGAELCDTCDFSH